MMNDHEKMMAKIIKEIEEKGLTSQEEINAFLSTMMGKGPSDFKPDPKVEKIENLLHEASLAHTKKEARALLKEVLKLQPNTPEAYQMLGDMAPNEKEIIRFFKKGLKEWEADYGAENIERDKGYFWGILETRPYMRLKFSLAHEYIEQAKTKEALKELQELLVLSENDNLGVRYLLSTFLLQENKDKEFEELIQKFPEDMGASWIYNRLLYALRRSDTSEAKKLFKEAEESNPHVMELFMAPGKKDIAEYMPDSHDFITIGGKGEAFYYVVQTIDIWEEHLEKLIFLK